MSNSDLNNLDEVNASDGETVSEQTVTVESFARDLTQNLTILKTSFHDFLIYSMQPILSIADFINERLEANVDVIESLPQSASFRGQIYYPRFTDFGIRVSCFQTDWETFTEFLDSEAYEPVNPPRRAGASYIFYGEQFQLAVRKLGEDTLLELIRDTTSAGSWIKNETLHRQICCLVMHYFIILWYRYLETTPLPTIQSNQPTDQSISTTDSSKKEITNERDRLIIELFNQGYSEAEIGLRFKLEATSINNMIPALRKKYGLDVVPLRKIRRKK